MASQRPLYYIYSLFFAKWFQKKKIIFIKNLTYKNPLRIEKKMNRRIKKPNVDSLVVFNIHSKHNGCGFPHLTKYKDFLTTWKIFSWIFFFSSSTFSCIFVSFVCLSIFPSQPLKNAKLSEYMRFYFYYNVFLLNSVSV